MSNIYYVSKAGCDKNNGTKEAPVRTIEKAQALARENKNSTVYVLEGEYKNSLVLDERDSGTKYIGINATLTGGVSVAFCETEALPEEIKGRLNTEAKEKVRAIDIKKYGLSLKDFGEIYAIGAYHTADKYDNGKIGKNFEATTTAAATL